MRQFISAFAVAAALVAATGFGLHSSTDTLADSAWGARTILASDSAWGAAATMKPGPDA